MKSRRHALMTQPGRRVEVADLRSACGLAVVLPCQSLMQSSLLMTLALENPPAAPAASWRRRNWDDKVRLRQWCQCWNLRQLELTWRRHNPICQSNGRPVLPSMPNSKTDIVRQPDVAHETNDNLPNGKTTVGWMTPAHAVTKARTWQKTHFICCECGDAWRDYHHFPALPMSAVATSGIRGAGCRAKLSDINLNFCALRLQRAWQRRHDWR